MQQLTMLGGQFETKVDPYAVGDVLVKADGSRFVVVELDADSYAEPALICARQTTGAIAILFARDICYRSR